MQYHIDTILIWDTYKQDCECALCAIERNIEAQYAESYLSTAVMEPDARVEVNKYGFCREHLGLLYKGSNKLGLALQLHTHLQAHAKELDTQLDTLANAASDTGIMRSRAGFDSALKQLDEYTEKRLCSCVICRYMDANMERYCQSVADMWVNETEFTKLYNNSKGLCLPHFSLLMNNAKKSVSSRKLKDFIENSCRIQKDAMQRLSDEIEWFTKKFDYRNANEPWGNSRDAVLRVINKIKGRTIE